jgi:hypothetical protein
LPLRYGFVTKRDAIFLLKKWQSHLFNKNIGVDVIVKKCDRVETLAIDFADGSLKLQLTSH